VALASLHGSDLATAPVRSVVAERDSLRHELELVERYWPEVALEVRRLTDGVLESAPETAGMVLSHGDFTPSQVLLEGDGTAVVDLDTLCWADPALDLGRFIAHLELHAAKLGGERAAPLVEELTAAFLEGHSEASGDRRDAATEAAHRITLYRTTSLARSSLHACRQLKDRRLELALSLLESINTRRA
jgi:aminoglycoside phosphotransferase (APT) family kinase protein